MRRNALYGDRLSIDLRNMLYNWCEQQINQAKEANNYAELEMELLKSLAAALPFTQKEFDGGNADTLTEKLFTSLQEKYSNQTEQMRQQALPVFKQIREQQGERIENVVVPMTDGFHNFQIVVNMNNALKSDCKEMVHEFEKLTTLQIIDDEWKEHLRELDELKQSTGNAQYEQKDPLLIYKIESFEMFGQMLHRLNNRVLGLLFRSTIDSGDEVEEAKKVVKRDNPKVKAGHEELAGSPVLPGGGHNMGNPEMQQERISQAPIVNEIKVGRNDLCPCGSGKKFKNCHGVEA